MALLLTPKQAHSVLFSNFTLDLSQSHGCGRLWRQSLNFGLLTQGPDPTNVAKVCPSSIASMVSSDASTQGLLNIL